MRQSMTALVGKETHRVELERPTVRTVMRARKKEKRMRPLPVGPPLAFPLKKKLKRRGRGMEQSQSEGVASDRRPHISNMKRGRV